MSDQLPSKSIQQISEEQGVQPITDIGVLAGATEGDIDEFIRDCRGEPSPEVVLAQKLLVALKSVVTLAGETFRAWDADQDMRVGKVLRFLSDPKLHGYRADIDAIHAAVKEAEEFLS